MKGNNGVKFFSVILIIGVLTYLANWGLKIGDFEIPSARDITLGIDIKGGYSATLQAVQNEANKGKKITAGELESAKSIIGQRLDNKGISDRNIIIDPNHNRIIVEIPWKSGEKDFNPQKAVAETIQTAQITFREVDESKTDPTTGAYLPTDKIVVNGDEVKDAGIDPQGNGTEIFLELNDKGAKSFSEATGRLIGKKIAIFLDDKLLSAPTVQSQIPNGRAQISGQSTPEEASKLAALIRSGSLPFKLDVIKLNVISPILGEGALNVSIIAGAVALVLVWLFMLFYYRLPGILANIALLGHTVLQLLFISWVDLTTLSLPGIAGVILTIGMGVDANIIIFERIKEELRNGKTLRAAVDVGFKRAFSAILDANVTTLISAVALFYFGTGPIKGFAYTLGLGVALSFITAVFISRIMLQAVANVNIAKHPFLYGVKVKAKEGV